MKIDWKARRLKEVLFEEEVPTFLECGVRVQDGGMNGIPFIEEFARKTAALLDPEYRELFVEAMRDEWGQ